MNLACLTSNRYEYELDGNYIPFGISINSVTGTFNIMKNSASESILKSVKVRLKYKDGSLSPIISNTITIKITNAVDCSVSQISNPENSPTIIQKVVA